MIAKWPLSTYFRSVRTNVAFTTNIAAGDTSHPYDDHQCEPTLGGEQSSNFKFLTFAISEAFESNGGFATGEAGTGQQQMGRGHLGLLRWKSNKPKQTKSNQTKNKPKYPEPNQTNASLTKPNQAKTKLILKFAGVLISPRWVVTAG